MRSRGSHVDISRTTFTNVPGFLVSAFCGGVSGAVSMVMPLGGLIALQSFVRKDNALGRESERDGFERLYYKPFTRAAIWWDDVMILWWQLETRSAPLAKM